MQTTKLSIALVLGVAVTVTSLGSANGFHSEGHLISQPRSSAELVEIIAFVERYGWPVDLGYLCSGLSLISANQKCLFRQIAVHTKTAELIDHGFNVPTDESPPLHVVIYHVSPLTGEFFLASVDGTLIRALFRARGSDFEPMSNKRAIRAFKTELTFWHRNFTQIEHDVLSKLNSPPFPEHQR